MMDKPPKNPEDNPALKALFKRDLGVLKGIYPEEVLNLVESNIDVLMRDYVAWQRALAGIAKKLEIPYTNINNIPQLIEQSTFDNLRKKFDAERPKKIVIGIAGPGAVGKETIKTSLGFETVVNTTTRDKRSYESQGQHYNFTDDSQFNEIDSREGFAVRTERAGRGRYGIQKQDIEKAFAKSDVVIIEENPANLTKLRDYLKNYEGRELVLVYVLPPSPVMPNLSARLADRCIKDGSDFGSVIGSTLNLRQLEEFNSVVESVTRGVDVLFVVNDDSGRIVGKIKDLIRT